LTSMAAPHIQHKLRRDQQASKQAPSPLPRASAHVHGSHGSGVELRCKSTRGVGVGHEEQAAAASEAGGHETKTTRWRREAPRKWKSGKAEKRKSGKAEKRKSGKAEKRKSGKAEKRKSGKVEKSSAFSLHCLCCSLLRYVVVCFVVGVSRCEDELVLSC